MKTKNPVKNLVRSNWIMTVVLPGFFKCVVAAFVLIIGSLLASVNLQAQNVTLTVSGIKTNKGQLIVSVFKDNESFKNEKPFVSYLFSKNDVKNGTLKVTLNLQKGVCGLALLDDENNNGKMEKNMFKIPKEGFGFSNFYLSGMSRPGFDDFKFEVTNAPIFVQSKLRYM